MTKYFSIENSLNEKIMGKIPQIKDFIYHCNIESDPNSIDKFIFQKIEIKPTLSNVILYENAIHTDFINTSGNIGFGFGNLISNKFKQILEKFNSYGFQFFETYIVQNNKKNFNYWQTNIYDFPFHFIDFEKTIFLLKDRDTNRNMIIKTICFNNLDEFTLLTSSMRYPKMIFFEEIYFNRNMNLDFFTLRYTEDVNKGIVSEKLKNELEKKEVSGIEFRPIEMSLQEWYHSGEREKIYGKI